MKSIVLNILVFILISILFFIAIQSIIAFRLIELKIGIEKEQLMNYALSSKTLKEKITRIFSKENNNQNEVLININEAEIFRYLETTQPFEWQYLEKIGYYISKFTSYVLFRKPNEIIINYETINKIQEAFYWEKQKRYTKSIELYNEIYKNEKLGWEEDAFVQLHYGFCLFMSNQKSESVKVLKRLINKYPGTHFADSAKLLLNYIATAEKKKNQIIQKNEDPFNLANVLFQMGEYKEAIDVLKKKNILSEQELYLYFRCLEELGELEEAVKGYLKLSQNKQNQNIALLANRRLILISNFYARDPELQLQAKNTAQKLGDEKFLQSANQGLAKIQSVEEKNQKLIALKDKQLLEFKEKMKVSQITNPSIENSFKNLESKETQTQEIFNTTPKTRKLRVYLMDGRILYSNLLFIKDNSVKVYVGKLPLDIKLDLLTKIDLYPPSEESYFLVEDDLNNRSYGNLLEKEKNQELVVTFKEKKQKILIRKNYKLSLE